MTRIERLLLWIPLLSLLAAPLAWGATGSSVDPMSPTDKQTWVTKISEAQSTLTGARLRYDTSVRDYARGRRANRARGDARAEVLVERNQASEALAQAEKQLEELLESARRAGVPPGWVREAMAAASAPAKRAD